MKTKDLILNLAAKNKTFKAADVLRIKKISRQTLAQHFQELIHSGQLIRLGTTRNARYVLNQSSFRKGQAVPEVSLVYQRKGLTEDRVYDEVCQRLSLKKIVSAQTFEIFGFAFNEMVNNAIEHSRAKSVHVNVLCDGLFLKFHVIDQGVGLFENVRAKFCLKDHFEACELVLKGKQTTASERHSGQGIFFTSKIADEFTIRSSRLQLIVDQIRHDVALKDVPHVQGTHIEFVIKQRTKKSAKTIFDAYSNQDFEFDKTLVTVRLVRTEGAYLSRSEARRLLFGLEKFRRIVLDFKGVQGVGQGFADEIFRVFKHQNPKIQTEFINATPGVEHMIVMAQKPVK